MKNGRESRNSGGISVGSSSILVIFVVLALTAFATLSLVSANSDARLTQRSAESVTVYYAADSEGVELLAALDTALSPLPPTARAAKAEELGWTTQGTVFSRAVQITDTQSLQISADFAGTDPQIVRWQVSNDADWQEQDSFILWDGETEGAPGLSALPAGLAP